MLCRRRRWCRCRDCCSNKHCYEKTAHDCPPCLCGLQRDSTMARFVSVRATTQNDGVVPCSERSALAENCTGNRAQSSLHDATSFVRSKAIACLSLITASAETTLTNATRLQTMFGCVTEMTLTQAPPAPSTKQLTAMAAVVSFLISGRPKLRSRGPGRARSRSALQPIRCSE